MKFCLLYQYVINNRNQNNFISLGPEKTVLYIRYFVISGPRCIKLFAGVFYGKNQETPAKKKISIAICIEICQSFFMAKKKSGKKFYATRPRSLYIEFPL